MQRRELLKMGMYGFGGLSLSQFMQARAYSTELAAQPGMGLATADNRHGDRTAIKCHENAILRQR